MPYILQSAQKQRCGTCSGDMSMICDEQGRLDRNHPGFYICFSCRIVARVGFGRLVLKKGPAVSCELIKGNDWLEGSACHCVTEFHYKDDEAGAYEDIDVRRLWRHFSRKHTPSHILIRSNDEQGQELSDALRNIESVRRALLDFIDAINVTGGIMKQGGVAKPAAEEDWADLGDSYLKACNALRIKPVLASG